MGYQFTTFVHPSEDGFDQYLAFVRRFRPAPTFADLRHKWRIFRNPHAGAFLFAHTDTELAATLSISLRYLVIPGSQESMPCFELGDGWTADNHRRKGLFHELGHRARELAFSQGGPAQRAKGSPKVEVIMGAPNPAAIPNWRKHKYVFTEEDGSHLVLRPSPLSFGLRQGLLRAQKELVPLLGEVLDLRRMTEQVVSGPTFSRSKLYVRELSFSDYERHTKNTPRMNDTAGDYLRFRFATSPDGYRYFGVSPKDCQGGTLYCALRTTFLGELPVLVVSECLQEVGAEPLQEGADLRMLPAIASAFYGNHTGLYHNARLHMGGRILAPLWERIGAIPEGYLVHRQQPLCFLFRDCLDGTLSPGRLSLIRAWRTRFHLSDCDVG